MNNPDAIDARVDQQLAHESEQVTIRNCRCGYSWHGLPRVVDDRGLSCPGTHVMGEWRP
ncbi:hypothetical protein [Rhodococcus jostii]|uniref:hypothetical protein n=1 Tax=Rhodococcus jostii TaxID=132919 RepID=UPI00362F5E13